MFEPQAYKQTVGAALHLVHPGFNVQENLSESLEFVFDYDKDEDSEFRLATEGKAD
jgi:hypothetical protein